MYIKKAWSDFHRALISWLLLAIAALVMTYLTAKHNLAGAVRGNLVSVITIIAIGVMVMMTVITLVMVVMAKYRRAVALEMENSDNLLDRYADKTARSIEIEPMIRRTWDEDDARIEKRKNGWVLKIQNLEIGFSVSVMDGKVYGLQILHVPSGDHFTSILKGNEYGHYYTVYWDGIVLGDMHERTLTALWMLADCPPDYCALRKGH